MVSLRSYIFGRTIMETMLAPSQTVTSRGHDVPLSLTGDVNFNTLVKVIYISPIKSYSFSFYNNSLLRRDFNTNFNILFFIKLPMPPDLVSIDCSWIDFYYDNLNPSFLSYLFITMMGMDSWTLHFIQRTLIHYCSYYIYISSVMYLFIYLFKLSQLYVYIRNVLKTMSLCIQFIPSITGFFLASLILYLWLFLLNPANHIVSRLLSPFCDEKQTWKEGFQILPTRDTSSKSCVWQFLGLILFLPLSVVMLSIWNIFEFILFSFHLVLGLCSLCSCNFIFKYIEH